ncbi:MAG: C39 family peptidase [Rhodospirillales bacterium]
MTAAGAGGRPRRAAVLALLVGAGIGAATAAAAGEVDILGPAAGGTYRVGVESLQERRFRTVYRQAHDLSCGAAALASLLTYHYRRPVSEEEVAAAMRAAGDPAKIDRLGFSLLDMQRYLAGRGLAADGFRVNLDRLAAAGLPAITLMEAEGYRHFVLIKGIRGDTVLVGDPAKGIRVLRRQAFEAAWSGIAFLIRDGQTLARTAFNRDEEWAAPAPAPLGTALDRGSLADITGIRAPFPRF